MALATVVAAVGSLAAAGGTLALGWLLRDRRGRPGADWLLAVLAVQFVLTFSYGVGYVAFAPTVRWAIEVVFWVSYAWLGTLFVAFGLAYTGRDHVIRSPWFGVLVAITVGLTALVVTNPLHHLVWEGFRVEATHGLATARYARRGGALLLLGLSGLGASVGTLLLVDTIISYGTLYRRAALTIALSPIPPGIGLILWTFEIWPAPGVNVAPVLFLVHLAFDGYAYLASGVFEFHPATRRVGNRAVVTDLGNPVVVIDGKRRVVTLNPRAQTVFGLREWAVLGESFVDCYDGDEIDPTVRDQTVGIDVGAQRRTFKVTSTTLSDSSGSHLGYTLVFQDITAERQREQRLSVLNRVLRHNLRNDLTVVQMRLDHAATAADDESVLADIDAIEDATDGLIALSEKARAFEQIVGDAPDDVAVGDAVDSAVATIEADHPNASISVQCDEARLRTSRSMLDLVVTNLVENAVEHGTPDGRSNGGGADADEPTEAGDSASGTGGTADVTVSVKATAEGVTLTVEDRGPGIPEHELAVLEDGDESALEHGSGLGLWLVKWGVRSLGGTLAFDTGEDGTTVTVRLPSIDPAT